MEKFRKGDLLFLYVASLGIVAVGKVVSELISGVSDEDKYRYPFRVRIELLWHINGDPSRAVPLFPQKNKDVIVEPAFTVRTIHPLTGRQCAHLLGLIGVG